MLHRKPQALARTGSLPALKDACIDAPLLGSFGDILGRSRRYSALIRDDQDNFGPRVIRSKLAGLTPPPTPPRRHSHCLGRGDWMQGFRIGNRVCLIGRAGVVGMEERGSVLAAGKTNGCLIVLFDSTPGLPRSVKAGMLHLVTKEEEESETQVANSAYDEREARRRDRIRRIKTTE